MKKSVLLIISTVLLTTYIDAQDFKSLVSDINCNITNAFQLSFQQ